MKDNTQIAVAIFDDHAQDYQEKYMDVSLYHNTLDTFCNYMPKEKPQILELACGPGNITKYLMERRPDFEILSTDLSPKMLHLAQLNNPKSRFKLLDSRKLHEINTPYDAIVFGFGLPYLSKDDAIAFIKNASRLLNSNGVLYLSTMEGDDTLSGWKSPSSEKGDRIYITYYEATCLTKALTAADFMIIDTERIIYSDNKGGEITDLIIIARKSTSLNQKLK